MLTGLWNRLKGLTTEAGAYAKANKIRIRVILGYVFLVLVIIGQSWFTYSRQPILVRYEIAESATSPRLVMRAEMPPRYAAKATIAAALRRGARADSVRVCWLRIERGRYKTNQNVDCTRALYYVLSVRNTGN